MRLPRVEHAYQNHHLDSRRWAVYEPRPGDIIVTSSYKSGTTFTQEILRYMLYGHLDPVPEYSDLSPWPDARFHKRTRGELREWLDRLEGRRFLKSHLPLDGLPYYADVKYLIVARDPRDVFMSLANHYANYTEHAYAELNGGDRVGEPLPPCPGDIHELWRSWITRGWFPWESEGWPFWGNLHHTRTYWEWRHLPNLLFLHYADMRADHGGAVRRIAAFVGHPVDAADVERIVAASDFESARQRAIEYDERHAGEPRQFHGGEASFIYQGTNGRWRGLLDEGDLELYERAKERVLPPDCAEWLEQGGEVGIAHKSRANLAQRGVESTT